jgi:hypothetical protein
LKLTTCRYETWYTANGNYLVAADLAVHGQPFLQDVSGDQLDDAVVWYSAQGTWAVATNTGGHFAKEQVIDGSGHCGGAALWADVAHISNQTHAHLLCSRADGVFARPASPSGSWTLWLAPHELGHPLGHEHNHGVPDESHPQQGRKRSHTQAHGMADVNGDGLVDLIMVTPGGLFAALSSGAAFLPPRQWLATPLPSEALYLFGDVTGDGRADAVVVTAGLARVATSTGGAFSALTAWLADQAVRAPAMLAPIRVQGHKGMDQSNGGDQASGSVAADLVLYAAGGTWTVAASNGRAFARPAGWVADHGRASVHGKPGGPECSAVRVARVFSSSAFVPVAIWADGVWAGLPPQYGTPTLYNNWQGWYEHARLQTFLFFSFLFCFFLFF